MIIKDGKGRGYEVKVDEDNRLHTHAFTTNVDTSATINGDVFDISSNTVTLTSANESGLLYVKNNENDDLLLSLQFVNIDASTGGSGGSLVTYYFNSSTGTLISGATAANVLNRRIGSADSITVDAYKGVEGSTITDGTSMDFPSTGFSASSPFVLPKGASFAVSITPPTGNTSMRASIGLFIVKNATIYGKD